MTFDEYLNLVTERRSKYPELREGQALFNTLSEVDPGLANSIVATVLDPFNWPNTDTDRLSEFYHWARRNWGPV